LEVLSRGPARLDRDVARQSFRRFCPYRKAPDAGVFVNSVVELVDTRDHAREWT
jgi:hypothetical protein